jgi:nicotinamide-nucleotide amidase
MSQIEKDLETISRLSIENNISLCTAESVTSGYLQFILSQSEGTLQFFNGGITTYNIDQKVQQLNIDYQKCQACNCVSQEIANQMAINACKLFNCNSAIAITGYASTMPEKQIYHKHAYFSISMHGKIEAFGEINSEHKEPKETQIAYAEQLIHELRKTLQKNYG